MLCLWKLHVVVHHPIVCHLLILGAWATVVGVWVDADATTWSEDACHFNVLRIHKVYEILHNLIDAIFMEVAVVAERE